MSKFLNCSLPTLVIINKVFSRSLEDLKAFQFCFFLYNFSTFIDNLNQYCPRISSLRIYVTDRNRLSSFHWLGWIPRLKNLTKIEIDTYVPAAVRWMPDDYNRFLRSIQMFTENPLTKLKKLKMSEIGAFFQDDFLCRLHKAFPNLETFEVQFGRYTENLVNPLKFWSLTNLPAVLKSLGSVKNLAIPSMDLTLVEDEFDDTLAVTEKVFNEALEIMNESFPQDLGDLKIVDENYGNVILKKKNLPPQLFNRQQVNRRPVVDIVHDSDNQEILLRLKSSRPGSPNAGQEVILSEEIVKKLYEMFIR